MDDEFSEPIRHHVSGLGVTSVTNTWHQILSLEAPSHSTVNTLGLSPTGCNFVISFRLVTNEPLGSLLDDGSFGAWYNHDCSILRVILLTTISKFNHHTTKKVKFYHIEKLE